jgi:hypothetical protein
LSLVGLWVLADRHLVPGFGGAQRRHRGIAVLNF